MQNQKYKIINIFIIFGLVFPFFALAQTNPQYTAQMPKTMEEAKSLGLRIFEELPGAVKEVWQKEALPLWREMWNWVRPIIEPWWDKFLGLLGKEVEKRRPELEKEFQKEKEEIQEDLWERFKELLE